MKRNITILTTVIFAFIAPVFAAGYQYNDLKNSADIPTIDEEEKKCLENTSVYEYPSCTQKAETKWDEEIIKNLEALKKVMNKDDYKYIEDMNKFWSKTVEKQIKVIDKFVFQKDGIIYQTSGIDSILQLKKQYAMFLRGIYFDYYEDAEQKFN